MENADTRLLGYARVSTDDQDLALQRKALLAHGVEPGNILEEHGSGGKMDRPVWNRVLRSMRRGDSVVVWRLDRLGRTLTGVIETVEEMDRQGVNLVSLHERIDTKSAMGKAFFRMALIFAELERDLISERTTAGIRVRQAMGVRFGRLHSIRDNAARLAAFRPHVEDGTALEMTPRAALEILNAADPAAAKITSLETFRRWRRDGFPGIE
ncbi:recombinase family protein [Leisingera sp. F5]|uniref:recombinase family protein n=1 Tax=Leisingera sp. F5 TaxID=1813816 RepID=UPI000A9CD2E5|nr:recombinase family protein [Leisingera sp. F5]